MTLKDMISHLNADLSNEYKHLHFYLHSSIVVQGLHREELAEYFSQEAYGEMLHVQEFGRLILGLKGVLSTENLIFPHLTKPQEIIRYAWEMESEVINNFIQRIAQARTLEPPDGEWIEIFLEGQIQKSREDADHLYQMLQ